MILRHVLFCNESKLQHLIETFEISPKCAKRLVIPKVSTCLSNNIYVRKSSAKALDHFQVYPKVALPSLLEVLKEEGKRSKKPMSKILDQANQIDPQAVIPSIIEALQEKSPG